MLFFQQNVTPGKPQPFTDAMATCFVHMVERKASESGVNTEH